MTTFFKAYSCHACVNLLINPNLASTKGKMIQKNLSKIYWPRAGQKVVKIGKIVKNWVKIAFFYANFSQALSGLILTLPGLKSAITGLK